MLGSGTDVAGKCKFYVEKKKRLCKLSTMKDSEFCGEHQPEGVKGPKGNRIPCPFDSAHTVFEVDLESHSRICNSRPVAKYYERLDVNIPADSGNNGGAAESLRWIDVDRVSQLVPLLKSVVDPWINSCLHSKEPEPTLSSSREEQQTTAIASHVPVSVLRNYTLVEIGAGRAKLSHQFVIMNADRMPSKVYLVDRSRPRSKFDKKIRSLVGHAERLHIDLKDLDLSAIPLETDDVVVIAKHACGAATCFTLTAVKQLITKYPSKCFHVCIATCCHQLCSNTSFCDQSIFEGLISREQFDLTARISSWAICNIAKDEHIAGIPKSQIGRYAKMFIDISRCSFLNRLGLAASQHLYCHRSITPENVVIKASGHRQ